MAFVPSKYQQAFFDAYTGTTSNIVLDAKAGSGKSTTIIQSINLSKPEHELLFLAFNKDIVEELKKKVSRPNTMVSTIHGMGSKLMVKYFRSNKDENKYRDIVKTLITGWDIEEDRRQEYQNKVLKFCELMRLALCDTMNQALALMEHHSIEISNGTDELSRKFVEHTVQVIQAGRKITSTIDFTDMLYLPHHYNLKPWQYDVVYVDECQDLSTASRMLMLRHIKPGGRFIAVGDKSQCIYSFAGADIESFNTLCTIPNTMVMPLSVCYRCCKAVIREAQTIVPDIEHADGAPEGEVVKNGSIKSIKDGDFVLCRATMPLVKLCLKFLSEHRKATIKGRDIGTNLINFIEKSKLVNLVDLPDYFAEQRKILMRKVCTKYRMEESEAADQSEIVAFDEKVSIVHLLAEGKKTCQEVVDKIKLIFADKTTDGIILSTIHKAKGLEADRVHIIQPEILPAPWAKKPKDIEQELNLLYVCITRARYTLSFVTDFDAYDKKSMKRHSQKDTNVASSGRAMW